MSMLQLLEHIYSPLPSIRRSFNTPDRVDFYQLDDLLVIALQPQKFYLFLFREWISLRFNREKSATFFPFAKLGIVELVSTENYNLLYSNILRVYIFRTKNYSMRTQNHYCASAVCALHTADTHTVQQERTQSKYNITLLGALKFALSLAELVIIQKA